MTWKVCPRCGYTRLSLCEEKVLLLLPCNYKDTPFKVNSFHTAIRRMQMLGLVRKTNKSYNDRKLKTYKLNKRGRELKYFLLERGVE